MAEPGDLANLKDPVAELLLRSTIPARLAFTAGDGTPRVTPIWFHWDGQEIVMVTSPGASKVKAIRRNPRVAITIDIAEPPYKVLNIRGAATITNTEGSAPEYELAAKRHLGDEMGAQWVRNMGGQPQARIAVRPDWAQVIDFSRAM